MRQMAKSSDIILNPDVLDGKQGSETPLSDLYGMPVFGADMEQRFEKARQQEAEELGDIREEIFHSRDDREAEELAAIRSRIFQAEASLSRGEAAPNRADQSGKASLFIIEAMVLVFLIILIIYQKHRQKRRGKIGDDAYDYGE